MEPNTNNTMMKGQRDYNLDLIKAICISLVLIWHLEPFDVSIPNITRLSANIIFKELLIALYFQVTLIAVPAFLITSQYLYIRKLKQNGFQYFFKRMGILVYITLFWISIQLIFYYFVSLTTSTDTTITHPLASIRDWIELFMVGGPSLPVVGNSVFYFLTTLIVLTILSTLFIQSCTYEGLEIFIGILVIIGSLVHFQRMAFQGNVILFTQINNFILYVPVAYFISTYGHRLRITAMSILWLVYFLLCLQDIQLRHMGLQFNIYGRASIVFGASALVCSLVNRKNIQESKLVHFLSHHSLGIFALHRYIQYFVTIYLMPVFVMYGLRKKTPFWEVRINLQVLSIGFITILFTLFCVYILGKTPLRKFVK